MSPFHRVNSPLDAPKKRTNIKKRTILREKKLCMWSFGSVSSNIFYGSGYDFYQVTVPVPVRAPYLDQKNQLNFYFCKLRFRFRYGKKLRLLRFLFRNNAFWTTTSLNLSRCLIRLSYSWYHTSVRKHLRYLNIPVGTVPVHKTTNP